MSRPSLTFALLCVLYAGLSPAAADFGGLTRGMSAVGGCLNTVSGRWFMADDQGRVCPRDAFDYTSGCCPAQAPQHQCDSCDAEGDRCCSSYEHCVSCCMAPAHAPEKAMAGVPRGLNQKQTGLWGSPFEYCRGVCRTTSRSTAHENAFIDDRRFCFAAGGRPRVPTPPAPPLPASVTAVAGPLGASCDDACAGKDMQCVASHFAAINTCNALRTAFMCEAGCGLPEGAAAAAAAAAAKPAAGAAAAAAPAPPFEMPGYMSGKAPKGDWPAFCFMFFDAAKETAGLAPSFNCSASATHVQRLCPCHAVAGGGSPAAAAPAKESGVAAAGGGGAAATPAATGTATQA